MCRSGKHWAVQAVVCLSFWGSLTTINKMHLLVWKPALLVSQCSVSAGVLYGPLMAVSASCTAVCVSVQVEACVFLCSCLFSLASRKKWNLYIPCFHFLVRCLTMLRWLALFASSLHAQNGIRQGTSVMWRTSVRVKPILTGTLNAVTKGATGRCTQQ